MSAQPDYNPIARFPLPANWTPEGTWCVLVTIPADQEYFSALIGLLDLLKWSQNFARDPTKTGAATVCRTWQAALENEPIVWREDCDMVEPYKHRVKPGAWWITQENSGPGGSWVDIIIGCCGPEDGPLADEGKAGTDAADVAGVIMRGWYMKWLTIMHECIVSVDCDRADFEALALSIVPPGTPSSVIEALGDAFDVAEAMDVDTLETMATSECTWAPQHRCFQESLEDQGWTDALNDLASLLTCALNSLDDTLVEELNGAAEELGSGFSDFVYENAGGGGGSGFGETGGCDWITIPLGTLEHTAGPGSANEHCEAWEFDCPAGYRLAGIYIKYKSTGNGSISSPRVLPSPDFACYAAYPDRAAWGPTSAWFGEGYNVATMRLAALTDAEVFEDNGFDLTDRQPTGNQTQTYVAGQHLGPAHFVAAVRWAPSSTTGVYAGLEAWAILQQYP